jgi:CubicO group peptidase (beta-lactamase class C family)
VNRKAMLLIGLLVLAIGSANHAALAEDWRQQIDELYERWDSTEKPGVMLCIIQDGQIVHSRGFGMANIEKQIRIDKNSEFNLASISKQFTAAAIALLVLDEKLSVEDDIRTFCPYLPEYEQTITVGHLVHHISGLPDVYGVMEQEKIEFKYAWGNEDVLPILAQMDELDFTPGEKYSYSNSNYILLAEVVHKVSGQTLREFVKQKIFDPLEMRKTRVDDNLSNLTGPNATESYRKIRKNEYRHDPRNDYVAGDGNVVTSVIEFARWDANFRSGKVGGADFLKMILTPGKLNSGKSTTYAFGINVTESSGRRRYAHRGSWLGYRCYWGHYPDEGATFLVFGNHGIANLRQAKVEEIYFGAREASAKKP